MPDAIAQDPFTRLARELSDNGGLIETLLATHPSEGDCRGCRLPGARVPITAPCSLALLAASIRAADQHSGAAEVERPGSRSARGALGRGASTGDGR
jgi:hypothetical protein